MVVPAAGVDEMLLNQEDTPAGVPATVGAGGATAPDGAGAGAPATGAAVDLLLVSQEDQLDAVAGVVVEVVVAEVSPPASLAAIACN